MNMIASCKRGDDLLAEYITLTECSYYGYGSAKGSFPKLPKCVRREGEHFILGKKSPQKPKEAT